MLRNTRTTLLAALVAALAVSALVFAAGAGAQRTGASRQANQNAPAGEKKRVIVGRGSETRQGSRVTITADDSLKDYSAYRSGDRFYVVLPKSAAGAGARGGSGRGYTDMQVQQRGDSVVLSYRVQPGAKPRVEQKFNRLDVVFDVPEGGGQQQAAPSEATRAQQQQQQQAEARNQTAAQQSNQTAAPTPNPNTRAAANAAEAARTQAEQAATNAATTTPPVLTAGPPPAATDPNAQPGATPAAALTPEATPAATPAAEAQLAQAQPPAATAPVSITKPATADPSGATLGTFLLRNWALTLILALVVVGLGLVFAARRSTAATREPAEGLDADGAAVAPDASRDARAKEASAAALREASASAQVAAAAKASKPKAAAFDTAGQTSTLKATTPDASTLKAATPAAPTPAVSTPEVAESSDVNLKPLAAATALAGGAAASKSRKQSRKEARQGAKKKKKGARADEPELEETTVAAPAVQETGVHETAVEAAPETAVEVARERAVEETTVEETFVETPAAEEAREEEFVAAQPAVEETTVVTEEVTLTEQAEEVSLTDAEQAAETQAFLDSPAEEVAGVEEAAEVYEAPAVDEVETPEAAVAETSFDAEEAATVEVEAPHPVTEIEPVAQEAFEPEVAEPEAVETETVEAEAPAAFKGIEPAFAPDPERVQAETRQLLEGGAYDRGVIATRDAVARQMIAAELLSALAGRNPQRRERAGAAYVEQGFYDETARDLHEADAPAERAAAARSLALLGDRAATPLLVEALEDSSLDVRRAAVEALGALRDPSAVEPLEALLERERNERHRIPPRVIRVAADSCRDAAAELDAELAAVVPVPAAEERAAAPVEPEPVAEVAEAETTRTTEVAAWEGTEESSIAPFVGEQDYDTARADVSRENAEETLTLAPEPAFERGFAYEEEETLVAERPAAAEAGVDPLVADLSEELSAAESRSFETAVAEPEAVAETGIEPRAATEEYAEEVSEPFATAPEEEFSLEPYQEPAAETYTTETPAPAPRHADPGQAALFDDDAAEEVTREVAPYRADAPAVDEAAASEWFDFDIREMREEPRPAAAEAYAEAEVESAPPPAREHVFESSSGETFTSYTPADAAETYAAEEPPAYAEARGASTRDVEAYDSAETYHEEAAPSAAAAEKGLAPFDEHSTVPASIQQRLASRNPSERAEAIVELSRVDTDEAFQQICAGFDDPSRDVRSAAARALYELRSDRAESFTRALREASPERRREIGASISTSGLAGESISQLTGESRERTYEAFSLLFLMAKAGEVSPLVRAIEGHPNNEVRLAVVKLLALSGQKEILPAFRRLAVRGSLPTEVRSAVMEAIYQISSSQPTHA